MSLATPLALALGLLSVPLILLYLLRPRREQVRVPSTFLWRQALEEVQANAPWQKLRRNLLLRLQLVILTLLVLALARPLLRTTGAPGGDVVLVLDTSGSMASVDIAGGTRFEAAKQRAAELARDLGQRRRIALITAGPGPRLLAGPTTDRNAVLKALADLANPHGESELRDATILARSIAGRLSDPTIVLIGDGGPVDVPPPDVPHPVRFEPIRGGGANAGILTLATRPGAAGRQLWVSIGNYGPARTIRISFSMDGRLFDAEQVQQPANGTAGREVNDLPEGQVIEARLDVQDALSADNVAWHIDAQGPPARVLLYGEPSPFLERALGLLNGVQLERAAAGTPAQAGYDVYIMNGVLPPKLPQTGNLLLLGPPDNPLVPVTGRLEGVTVTSEEQDSLLLRYVDLRTTSIGEASVLAPPDWMETLASAGETPILAAGESDGRKVVALAFTPDQSDLPLQVAFPILVDNLISYLRPQLLSVTADALRPGETVQLGTLPEGNSRTIVSPDGARSRVEAGTTAVYVATALPGVYEVRNGEQVVSRFAVNAGSPNESAITTTTETPIRTTGAVSPAPPGSSGRERWWPLLLVALAVGILEWWVYNRRQVRATGRRRGLA